jgi:hypothetical protein
LRFRRRFPAESTMQRWYFLRYQWIVHLESYCPAAYCRQPWVVRCLKWTVVLLFSGNIDFAWLLCPGLARIERAKGWTELKE